MVEREGSAFYVDVEYEWLPSFCYFCQTIGHSLQECRYNPREKPLIDSTTWKYIKKASLQYIPKQVDKDADIIKDSNQVINQIDKGKGILIEDPLNSPTGEGVLYFGEGAAGLSATTFLRMV